MRTNQLKTELQTSTHPTAKDSIPTNQRTIQDVNQTADIESSLKFAIRNINEALQFKSIPMAARKDLANALNWLKDAAQETKKVNTRIGESVSSVIAQLNK